MARCPYCGMTIRDGSLPCPYCEGGTINAAPRTVARRFCARCGQDVTALRDVWCPGCGFRIRSMETPPPAPVPATVPRASTSVRLSTILLLLAVAAFVAIQIVPPFLESWGADPSIHEPTVTPTGVPGHSSHETGAQASVLAFTVRGHDGTVPVTLYRGVYDAMPDRITGYVGDDEEERYRRVLDERLSSRHISEIAATIASMTDDPDDRARIAVSVVQHLDYDRARAAGTYYGVQYPYETLWLGSGVCSDKSVLLAALLRELGFGVALLEFDAESHMAVGLRCPAGYDYRGTGYAFVESTAPAIMTDAEGKYVGGDLLTSMPGVIPVADGRDFASIAVEAADAREWNELRGMGRTLDPYHYGRWKSLSEKYGIVPKDG